MVHFWKKISMYQQEYWKFLDPFNFFGQVLSLLTASIHHFNKDMFSHDLILRYAQHIHEKTYRFKPSHSNPKKNGAATTMSKPEVRFADPNDLPALERLEETCPKWRVTLRNQLGALQKQGKLVSLFLWQGSFGSPVASIRSAADSFQLFDTEITAFTTIGMCTKPMGLIMGIFFAPKSHKNGRKWRGKNPCVHHAKVRWDFLVLEVFWIREALCASFNLISSYMFVEICCSNKPWVLMRSLYSLVFVFFLFCPYHSGS